MVNELQRIAALLKGIGLHDQQKKCWMSWVETWNELWYLEYLENHVDSLHYLMRSFSHLTRLLDDSNRLSCFIVSCNKTSLRGKRLTSSQLCIFSSIISSGFVNFLQFIRICPSINMQMKIFILVLVVSRPSSFAFSVCEKLSPGKKFH